MADERGAVRRIEDRLYSRTASSGVRGRSGMTKEEFAAPEGWKVEEATSQSAAPAEVVPTLMMTKPQKRFPFATIFFGALIFFVLAVGLAVYTFLRGGNIVSPDNIDLVVLGPSLIDGGKEATFQITITNRNASAIELVDLIVEYPEGTRSATDLKTPLPAERLSLGTIGAGQSSKQTVRAVLFGEEGGAKVLKATLEYHVAGSNAVFVKETQTDLRLGSSPVSLTVEGPDETISGQPLSFTIRVRSNAQAKVEHVALEAQYPFGFSVTNASPESAVGDSLWRLGALSPGEEKVVRIEGILEGQDNEERVFRFLTGSESDETEAHIKVPYLTMPHALTLKRPFVTAELALNGQTAKTVTALPGEEVQGKITWVNNLDTEVQDLEISAQIQGQALDRESIVVSRGFYRSLDSTIVWSRDEDQSLSSVAPGERGELQFAFTPKSASSGAAITNPEITVAISIKAKRVSGGSVPETISSAFTRTVRIGSALTIEARALHFSGPIRNIGPMPPRADQETTYTITFTARNPSNTISNTRVTTTLPSYVRYIGGVSPAGESVTFDQGSRKLTWNLGDLKAGAGFSTQAESVSFQIGLTPSLSQAGSVPNLTSVISAEGDDRFTGSKTSTSAQAPTTRLIGDSGFDAGMEVVQK